jgi:cytochrome c peroxidase
MARRLLRLATSGPVHLALGGSFLVAVLLCQMPDILASKPAGSGTAQMGSSGGSSQPLSPIDATLNLDSRKVALGERLFHDRRLSSSGRIACASCHDLHTNGGSAVSLKARLDTQTVFNAAFSYRFGWEGKFETLEAQALATLKGTMIDHGTAPERIYDRLKDDPSVAGAFESIYRQGPSEETIIDALAEFERSLVTPSRFDRWLKGDRQSLTDIERRGYETFVRLGCVSCHQGRNVGGNLMQRQGIFRRLASPLPAIVRVPSLRNIAETAPYFHDGSAATLKVAIRRMASAQLNRDLTDEEIARIAAFLGSLTGTYNGSPVRR